MQQPDISAWLDSVRVQLDPSPPPKKVELEWVLIGGIAAGLLLLLSGSIYWLSVSGSKKDEPVFAAASPAADPALVMAAAQPPEKKAPRSAVPVRETRVPRVTEEAPTLPVEKDSSPAPLAAAKAEARATTATVADNEPDRANSMAASRVADIKSTPERAEEPKPEATKTPRREPAPASSRPQPAKPAVTKLALAEPVAVPIETAAAAPTPSAPAPVIAMPRLKSMRAPNYPLSEMRAGNSGTTTLELLVLESGLVGDVTVLSSSGYPKLDAAAVTVAKKSWRFFPGTQDGKPMPMKIEAPVRFSLD